MVRSVIKTDELLSAVTHILNECKSPDVKIYPDINGRFILCADDLSGNTVQITLFDAEHAKFPEITITKRFEK